MKKVRRPKTNLVQLRLLSILKNVSPIRFTELRTLFIDHYGDEYQDISIHEIMQRNIRKLIANEDVIAEGKRDRLFCISPKGLERLTYLI